MNVQQKLMTAEDLWEMPEVPGKRFELVDGELVEMPGAGGLHSLIVILLAELLNAHVRERGLGYAFGDGLAYILARSPDRVRVPDVSFVSNERVPPGGIPEGFWPGAPDLAVEVVSPSDKANELHAKVDEYLEAGVHLVWIIWPRRQVVTVYTADGAIVELGSDDDLDGGDVLPEFRVRLSDLFEAAQ